MALDTTLGKELKKIRLQRDQVLYDMAQKIGMSSAMLSSIETGKKPAPEGFVDRLAQYYEEVANDKEHFYFLADLTKTQVKLKLDGDNKTKQLMVTFARSVEELSDEQKEQLQLLIEEFRSKGEYGTTKEKSK